jgi:hypothetical protein
MVIEKQDRDRQNDYRHTQRRRQGISVGRESLLGAARRVSNVEDASPAGMVSR